MAIPKILFFINTQYSSLADQQVAAKIGVPVQFRNAKNIKPTDPAEVCDGVMGNYVPPQYRGKPTAKAAVTAYQAELAKSRSATVTTTVTNAKAKAAADLAAAQAKLAAAEAEVTEAATPVAATPVVATAKVAAK